MPSDPWKRCKSKSSTTVTPECKVPASPHTGYRTIGRPPFSRSLFPHLQNGDDSAHLKELCEAMWIHIVCEAAWERTLKIVILFQGFAQVWRLMRNQFPFSEWRKLTPQHILQWAWLQIQDLIHSKVREIYKLHCGRIPSPEVYCSVP